MERRQVSTIEELQAAATDADVQQIVIPIPLEGVPSVRLSQGQALTSFGEQSVLRFAAGNDGLELSGHPKTAHRLDLGTLMAPYFFDRRLGMSEMNWPDGPDPFEYRKHRNEIDRI